MTSRPSRLSCPVLRGRPARDALKEEAEPGGRHVPAIPARGRPRWEGHCALKARLGSTADPLSERN